MTQRNISSVLFTAEEVSKTKYLGTIVTRDNLIEEEIKERSAAGN